MKTVKNFKVKLNKSKIYFIGLVVIGVIIGFQNCSQVNFSQAPPSTGPTNTTTNTIKNFQPAFAVRGLNCMACHGYAGSNVVTDFGYGSSNFGVNANYVSSPSAPTFFAGNNRTAFNDANVGGNQSGWNSWSEDSANTWTNFAITGSLFVPKATIPKAQAITLFGINNDVSLAAMLKTPGLMPVITNNGITSSPSISMVPASQTINEESNITITYPSQAEILSLIPSQYKSQKIVAVPITVAGLSPSSMTGFVPDSTNTYITNNSGPVQCYGDVVVNGVLFLNNLVLQTDGNGCRLYVTKTVFIQGPITYSSGNNIQITSSSAIIMGFSARRMGYLNGNAPDSGDSSTVREFNEAYLKLEDVPGGPWARFPVHEDKQYNPSGLPINGVAPMTFFDDLVLDAVSIGANLMDAADPNYLNAVSSNPNVQVVSESGTYSGPRAAINYTGLLLNAPHVHSRYFGNLNGVIIADVAYLARNPTANQLLEKFIYDSAFDNVQIILPALTTTILAIQQ